MGICKLVVLASATDSEEILSLLTYSWSIKDTMSICIMCEKEAGMEDSTTIECQLVHKKCFKCKLQP